MNAEVLKCRIFRNARNFLYQQGYTETTTQIIRNTDSGVNRRFRLDNGKFLRDGMDLALKKKVSDITPKVFELGPCFRQDKEDETHYLEFYMLETFSGNETLKDMIELMKGLTLQCIPEIVREFKEVSVRDFIADDLGIDISVETTKSLVDTIIAKYHGQIERNKLDYVTVNKYISLCIESSLTKNGCLCFLVDYPLCTIAIAKRKSQDSNCILRTECFLNGLELANGFEDCMDAKDLEARLIENNITTVEEEELLHLTRNGKIPPAAGIGIGIDRLCMLYKGR